MTDGATQTIPCRWVCQVCHKSFQPPTEGGICSICLQCTCRSHLRWTYAKDPSTGKRRLSFICTSCRQAKTTREGNQQPLT
jgi:hypothetical protein